MEGVASSEGGGESACVPSIPGEKKLVIFILTKVIKTGRLDREPDQYPVGMTMKTAQSENQGLNRKTGNALSIRLILI
jgi:hypothetical protein